MNRLGLRADFVVWLTLDCLYPDYLFTTIFVVGSIRSIFCKERLPVSEYPFVGTIVQYQIVSN